MRDLRHIKIPKIKDSITFEHLCKEVIESIGKFEQIQFNGSPGQSQDGVDIFARKKGENKWVGIQCKVRDNKLTEKDVIDELKKVNGFNPTLTEYQIFTTASRDSKLQEIIRTKYNSFLEEFRVKVKIVFWNDIEDILKEENSYRIYHRYYKEFFANNETLGHGIGKLVKLELGIGDSSDTQYEIMIGKIPKEKSGDYNGINYYKGCYFIINLADRRMETFQVPCYASDLEQCFPNRFDSFRISSWINSIKDINDFIYNNESSSQSYISKKKYKKYIEEIRKK